MSPDNVGRYRIKSELGRSGMATVYLAFDPISNREVAIKLLPHEKLDNLEQLAAQARFKRELKLIASLEHPAIVPVYDVGGEEDQQPFFVMRYMSGGSLAEMIRKGRFSLRDAALIIERVAGALDHAHSRGVIHRDIKPDNVLFDAGNNPYLSDFGVATFAKALNRNIPREVFGTPAYISPEQALGEDVDHRADIYGLGAMLYEMLTGERPFGKDTAVDLAIQHVNDPVPNLLKLRPDLPGQVDVIVKKAMAKNRENRYDKALQMAQELNRVAYEGEPTLQKIPALVDRQASPPASSGRTGWIVAGLILIVALAASIYALFGEQAVQRPPVVVSASPVPSLASPPTSPPQVTSTAPATPTAATPVPEIPAAAGGADKIAFLVGNQLYLMDTTGENLIQVRTDNSAKSQLQWLPDGRLAYLSRNCIYLLDVATRQPQELMCFVANELLEDFQVSPDGRLVAISIQRTLNILPFDPEVLQEIDSRFSLLAFRENCFYNQYAFRDVLWSNSGTQIAAHVVDTELVSSDQIFLLNVNIPDCDTVGPVRVAKIPGIRIDFESESSRRIGSYDWDGGHLFLLNDAIRNDGFGNLYIYDSQTRQGEKINPIGGECCYRDVRWSPDRQYIFFVFQAIGSMEIEFYYIPLAEVGNGGAWTPIPGVDTLFSTAREKPQPVLRPAP